jgi:hypothetical protein
MSRFALGRTVITSNAAQRLKGVNLTQLLNRHASGDWGCLCEEDRQQNDRALRLGERLMSSYKVYTDDSPLVATDVWVITEHDRSVTTILLPEDY